MGCIYFNSYRQLSVRSPTIRDHNRRQRTSRMERSSQTITKFQQWEDYKDITSSYNHKLCPTGTTTTGSMYKKQQVTAHTHRSQRVIIPDTSTSPTRIQSNEGKQIR